MQRDSRESKHRLSEAHAYNEMGGSRECGSKQGWLKANEGFLFVHCRRSVCFALRLLRNQAGAV